MASCCALSAAARGQLLLRVVSRLEASPPAAPHTATRTALRTTMRAGGRGTGYVPTRGGGTGEGGGQTGCVRGDGANGGGGPAGGPHPALHLPGETGCLAILSRSLPCYASPVSQPALLRKSALHPPVTRPLGPTPGVTLFAFRFAWSSPSLRVSRCTPTRVRDSVASWTLRSIKRTRATDPS
jgi:hypothetical protein